jgi:hypothetical protein
VPVVIILINLVFVNILSPDATVDRGDTPKTKVSTAMQGAMAYFDGTTTPCMVSKRRFLNMMVSTQMSSASSVLKVKL